MRILVTAHETGSANALVPVVRELSALPKADVRVLATGYAPRIFSAEGVSYRQVELPEDRAETLLRLAAQLLDEHQPELLILGTAWEKNLEKAFLQLAPERGIRTLTVVDNWSHFRERFVTLDGKGVVFPDRIAVIDEPAREEALREGVPPERVIVTGQPYLESIRERAKGPAISAQAAKLRTGWLPPSSRETTRLVLFVSEPFSAYSGPSTPHYRGYLETEALEALLDAALFVERRRGFPVQVVVKLHPREFDSSSSMAMLAALRGLPAEKEGNGLACLAAADVVVGMASMLLLESALLGRLTISFEPNGKEEVAFHGARIGAVAKAATAQQLADWLDSALTRPVSPPPAAVAGVAHQGATRRVVETVLELLGVEELAG